MPGPRPELATAGRDTRTAPPRQGPTAVTADLKHPRRDVEPFREPTWEEVVQPRVESAPWSEDHLVLDSIQPIHDRTISLGDIAPGSDEWLVLVAPRGRAGHHWPVSSRRGTLGLTS